MAEETGPWATTRAWASVIDPLMGFESGKGSPLKISVGYSRRPAAPPPHHALLAASTASPWSLMLHAQQRSLEPAIAAAPPPHRLTTPWCPRHR